MNTAIEFSGFAQLVADKFGVPQPFLIVGALTVTLGWICWRTRSSHVLMTRIWRLVFGKSVMADRDIAKFIESRNRLVTFRFFSGIPVRTLTHAKRLIHWSTVNDEEIADIRACGELFNREACRLEEHRIPGRAMQFLQWLVTWTLTSALLFALAGYFTESAVLQFKESKKWFFLSEQTAIPLSGEGGLSTKSCTERQARASAASSFSVEEATIICKVLADPENPANVRQYVTQQRFLCAPFAFIFAYAALVSFFSFRRGYFASKMKERICAKLNVPPANSRKSVKAPSLLSPKITPLHGAPTESEESSVVD